MRYDISISLFQPPAASRGDQTLLWPTCSLFPSLFPQHSTLGTSCSLFLFPQEFGQRQTLNFYVFHWELRFPFGRKERVVQTGKCNRKSSNPIPNVNETCSKEVFRSGIEFIQCHPLPKRSFVTDVCTKRQTTQVPIDSCYIAKLRLETSVTVTSSMLCQ